MRDTLSLCRPALSQTYPIISSHYTGLNRIPRLKKYAKYLCSRSLRTFHSCLSNIFSWNTLMTNWLGNWLMTETKGSTPLTSGLVLRLSHPHSLTQKMSPFSFLVFTKDTFQFSRHNCLRNSILPARVKYLNHNQVLHLTAASLERHVYTFICM